MVLSIADYYMLECNPFIWNLRCLMRCTALKIKPIISYLKTKERPILTVTGTRAFESTRRRIMAERGELRQLMWHKAQKAYLYSPIFWWGDEEVERYALEKALPANPIKSLLGHSGECICGVYTSVKEMLAIKQHFPAFFEKLVDLEKAFRYGSFMYDYKKRQRIFVSKL